MSNLIENCPKCKELEKERDELRKELRESRDDRIRLYRKLEGFKSPEQSKGALVIAFRQKQFNT